MSKKKKQPRVIGRRKDSNETDRLLAGELIWEGDSTSGFREAMLHQFGGEEGIKRLMHDMCPICSAGEQHEHN